MSSVLSAISTALQSYARQLMRVIYHAARSPILTGALERLRAAGIRNTRMSTMTPEEIDLVSLVLYWFWEYQEKRISPRELLEVLSHLLATFNTED